MDESREAIFKNLVLAALQKLGGREKFQPGARLAKEVRNAGLLEGFDTARWLRERKLSFLKVIQQYSDDGVVVEPRIGADMLVGFSGASIGDPVQPAQLSSTKPLRYDLYIALTRLSSSPYYYAVNRDVFTKRLAQGEPSIELASPTLEDLLTLRTAFVNSLDDKLAAKNTLQAALENSSSPLREFSARTRELGLDADWEAFNRESLLARLTEWAAVNRVQIRPTWFGEQEVNRKIGLRTLLGQLLDVMSDEEIKALSIPFAAVERLMAASRS
jgi:hypothetical protein